jgi:hypothetical protein
MALGTWGLGDLGTWGLGDLGTWGLGDLGRVKLIFCLHISTSLHPYIPICQATNARNVSYSINY